MSNHHDPGAQALAQPAKRKRSATFYVLVGLSALLVLGIGGCLAGGFYLGRMVQSEITKPVDQAVIEKELAGVPIYPNSVLLPKETQALHSIWALASKLLEGRSINAAMYEAPETPERLSTWYAEQLSAAGYSIAGVQLSSKSGGQSVGRTYVKGKEFLHVEPMGREGKTVLSIMRFNGFSEQEVAQMAEIRMSRK